MLGDPNWLYSTIAQSSAAIVAIVGGFITATMLMLTSEKRSLTHQQEDKKTRLEALKKEVVRLDRLYKTTEVDQFLNVIAEELKKEDELPPLEVFMRRYPYASYLDPSILVREYEALNKKRLEAKELMERHSNLISSSEFTLFSEWIEEHNIHIPADAYTIYQDEYYRLRNRKQQKGAEKLQKDISLWTRDVPLLHGIPSLQSTQYDLYYRGKEDRILEDIRLRLNGVRQETRLLESEITSIAARLRTFSYPPNLGRGIAVLGYLAVFGILFPVLVIWKEAYSDLTKTLTTFLFYIGIIGIFAYIVFQIRMLRRK